MTAADTEERADPPEPATTVLVVEDNPRDATLVEDFIEAARMRLEITVVRTLGEALGCIASRPPDAVLLDLGLPDVQGTGVVSRMREAHLDLPIVVLTGDSGPEMGLECIAAGADDYVDKRDLNGQVLERAIGYALTRRREGRLRELKQALEGYRLLSTAAASSSVTRQLAGAGPVQERSPEGFAKLVARYRDVMERYLDHLFHKSDRPAADIEVLATDLGDAGAGPRDLIDVHLGAMNRALESAGPVQSRAYATDGRLFALEMMGHLVDYYRLGVRRRRKRSKP